MKRFNISWTLLRSVGMFLFLNSLWSLVIGYDAIAAVSIILTFLRGCSSIHATSKVERRYEGAHRNGLLSKLSYYTFHWFISTNWWCSVLGQTISDHVTIGLIRTPRNGRELRKTSTLCRSDHISAVHCKCIKFSAR